MKLTKLWMLPVIGIALIVVVHNVGCVAKGVSSNESVDSFACKEEIVDDEDRYYVESDVLCVINGKEYRFELSDNDYIRIVENDKVIIEDVMLDVTPADSLNNRLFYVSNTIGKDKVLIDFGNKDDITRLSKMDDETPGYVRFYQKFVADYSQAVSCSFRVDQPLKKIPNHNVIENWLISVLELTISRYMGENIEMEAVKQNYIGIEDCIKCEAERYLNSVESEYTNPENVSLHFLHIDMCESVTAPHYVTYRMCTSGYFGGAHGGYTESLISYDHINNQKIDWNYIFKPEYKEKVIDALVEVVMNDSKYLSWTPEPDPQLLRTNLQRISDYAVKGIPCPALAEKGVAFSYQPYEIQCFAAGTFHFVVPYEKLYQYMTKEALKCIGK